MNSNSQQSAILKPSDLPSPPKTALEILRICSRPNVDSTELSRLVANDPVITAELLRVVNSPFYGLAREIRSIKQAIIVLGTKALRNMALCLSARDVVKADDMPGFAMDIFWEDSLRRACAARLLAKVTGADEDDCFTAGLLQDFGLLVMFYLNKDKLPYGLSFRLIDPEQRYRKEIELFYTTHDVMIESLASHWGLPQDFAHSLGAHHKVSQQPEGQSQTTLSAILHCADWFACVFSVRSVRETIEKCRNRAHELLGLDLDQLESLLLVMPEQTEKAASALGLRITQQLDFNQLMREANAKLAEENLDYQELTWQLQKALKERDELAAELNRELELAREIQLNLLPKVSTDDFPVSGINVSARQLSGDFYDYFSISNERIFFMLGDVSGKGIYAALLMAKICSLFRCLGKTMHDLPALMTLINNEIHDTSVRGMFATVIVGIYQPTTGIVQLVNAGHPPAFLFTAQGQVQTFEAEAPPLGINADTKFKEVQFTLAGGCLYLYSDGVVEGQTENGTELGLKGLMTHLLALRNKPARQRLNAIVSQLTTHSETLRDDVTLLALEE